MIQDKSDNTCSSTKDWQVYYLFELIDKYTTKLTSDQQTATIEKFERPPEL